MWTMVHVWPLPMAPNTAGKIHQTQAFQVYFCSTHCILSVRTEVETHFWRFSFKSTPASSRDHEVLFGHKENKRPLCLDKLYISPFLAFYFKTASGVYWLIIFFFAVKYYLKELYILLPTNFSLVRMSQNWKTIFFTRERHLVSYRL